MKEYMSHPVWFFCTLAFFGMAAYFALDGRYNFDRGYEAHTQDTADALKVLSGKKGHVFEKFVFCTATKTDLRDMMKETDE